MKPPPKTLLKLAGLLSKKKSRRNESLSIAEGVKLVEEALSANIPLYSVFFTEDKLNEHPDLAKQVEGTGARVYPVGEAEMKKISTVKTPPGIVALYRTDFTPVSRNTGLIVALQGISDPGNLGTILRAADWFGAEKALLSEEAAELHHPAAVRGSMGAVFRLPVVENTDLVTELSGLKASGWKVAVAATRGGQNPRPLKPAVLLLGDEQGRLPGELEALADVHFTIRKIGSGESLNLSAASSILLYEMSKV